MAETEPYVVVKFVQKLTVDALPEFVEGPYCCRNMFYCFLHLPQRTPWSLLNEKLPFVATDVYLQPPLSPLPWVSRVLLPLGGNVDIWQCGALYNWGDLTVSKDYLCT